MTRKCFDGACGGTLEKYPSALPPWLNPLEILEKTGPKLRVARMFAGHALKKGVDTLEEHVETWKCNRCGMLTFYEKKK